MIRQRFQAIPFGHWQKGDNESDQKQAAIVVAISRKLDVLARRTPSRRPLRGVVVPPPNCVTVAWPVSPSPCRTWPRRGASRATLCWEAGPVRGKYNEVLTLFSPPVQYLRYADALCASR